MLSNKTYISLDIDGVMNDYPLCWVKYINIKLGTSFESLMDAKSHLGENLYRELKADYRNSAYKANLPFNLSIKHIANQFIAAGFDLIVSTSRPLNDEKFPSLKINTENWLKKNGLKIDLLVDKKSEMTADLYSKILFHVDDEATYAAQFARQGVKTYLLGRHEAMLTSHNLICPIKSLYEILNYESQVLKSKPYDS